MIRAQKAGAIKAGAADLERDPVYRQVTDAMTMDEMVAAIYDPQIILDRMAAVRQIQALEAAPAN